MERLSVKLAWVLGIQLVLALFLWSRGSDYASFKAKDPLLTFDAAKIDRIEIGEGGGTSVALVREDGKWAIPSFAGFPAEGAKVSALLTRLASLKKGWPVATTSDAAKRFKLQSDSYERRIVLKSGGKTVGEILLGTAPSFKQVHVRAEGDRNIYAVAFAAHEAGTRGEDWMDRSLLNIPLDKIASISIGDVTLERKDGKFILAGLKPEEKQSEAAIYRLTSALAYPAFDAVTGKGPEAQAQVNPPTVEVTVKLTGANPVVLRYKKEAAGGAYAFTSSANTFVFRASEPAADAIVNAKREKLVEAPKAAPKEAPKGAAAGSAEAPKEAPKAAAAAPAEAPKQAPKETPKEAPKAAVAAPAEAPKQAPKETAAETPKAGAKETPAEASKETPAQPAAEASKAGAKEAPQETAAQAPAEAPKAEAKEAPKEAPKETAAEAPKEAPKVEAHEAAKDAPAEAPKDEAKEAPKEAPKDTAGEAPKEAPPAGPKGSAATPEGGGSQTATQPEKPEPQAGNGG